MGCLKTRENFEKLDMFGVVFKKDIFSCLSDMPKFDVVYSWGFVEHFINIEEVIEKHLEPFKPNGILNIGVPYFLGINKFLFGRLNPEEVST